jgi:glycogen debranching enzyme
VLRTIVGLQSVGFLPLALAESGRQRVRPSPDATLWLFVVAREIADKAGFDDPVVTKCLYPALVRAFVRLRGRRRRWAWITHEGLLAQGEDGVGLTWMDARNESGPVTPRRGLAVELQALWSAACDTLHGLASRFGHRQIAAEAASARDAARAAFRLRFWCNETYYPYDCIGDARTVDASIRPNALIALAVDPELFEDWQAAAILERVRADLLTPIGVRSLAPSEPAYRGYCDGSVGEREASYHQGSAWPFLLGCFVRASLRLTPDDPELLRDLQARLARAASEAPILGHVPQLTGSQRLQGPK